MISRRDFVIAATSLVVAGPAFSALPVPLDNGLAFRVMRKGTRIGTHAISFQRSAEALTVRINVEMVVRFGPIPVFRYVHQNVEKWHGDEFVSMDATANNDGDTSFAKVQRRKDGLAVEGSAVQPYIAPAFALAATHWNVAELSGPMINPENGELLRPKITDLGQALLTLGNGQSTAAKHYAWRDKQNLDLWYDDDGKRWAALTFQARDGSVVSYERI